MPSMLFLPAVCCTLPRCPCRVSTFARESIQSQSTSPITHAATASASAAASAAAADEDEDAIVVLRRSRRGRGFVRAARREQSRVARRTRPVRGGGRGPTALRGQGMRGNGSGGGATSTKGRRRWAWRARGGRGSEKCTSGCYDSHAMSAWTSRSSTSHPPPPNYSTKPEIR